MRYFVRSFWATLLLAVITIAVCVQIGRMVFPYLNDYRDDIAEQLEKQLGVDIGIGAIESRWRGLRPRISLLDVGITNERQEQVMFVQRVDVEISLLTVWFNWQDGIRRLRFDGLQSRLEQDEQGRWQVHGLPSTTAGKGNFNIDDPLDIFLFGRRVELTSTELSVAFHNDLETHIRIPRITLENDNDFHRLTAAFAVDDNQALRLVVEGTGDPRDGRHFDSRGYLHLNAFPTEKVLEALSGLEFFNLETAHDDSAAIGWHQPGRLTSQLWFEGTLQQGLSITGYFVNDGVPLDAPARGQWPQQVSSRFDGHWRQGSGWQLSLQNLVFQWQERSSPSQNLLLQGQPDDPLLIAFETLDIDGWLGTLRQAGWLEHEALEPLLALDPKGQLRNGQWRLTSEEDGLFELEAEVADAAITAWMGAPSIDGVDGYLQVSLLSGQLDLDVTDGIQLYFPDIYEKPLSFDTARGSFRWQVETGLPWLGIASGPIQVSDGDVSAVGHLNLALPLVPTDDIEPEMTLTIGVPEADAMLHRRYLPRLVPEALRNWLDTAVLAGELGALGFVYQGTLKGQSNLSRVIQFHADLSDAQIRFDPQWPTLVADSGSLWLDDNRLRISGVNGRMQQLVVGSLKVSTEWAVDNELHLSIDGKLSGNSRDAHAMLLDTPLKEILGDELNSWQPSGPLAASVRLAIPLTDAGEHTQDVALYFRDNGLNMPSLGLAFESVSGELLYSSETGIRSDSLTASLWGDALGASISSEAVSTGNRNTYNALVDFSGRVGADNLRRWLDRPELVFTQGSTALTGRIVVPMGTSRRLRITTHSDLVGVGIDLPPPFKKAMDEPLPTTASITVDPASAERDAVTEYRLTFGEMAQVRFARAGEQLLGVLVALNQTAPAIVPGRIQVEGRVPDAALYDWLAALDIYQSATQSGRDGSDTGTNGLQLPVQLDLNVGNLGLAAINLPEMKITGGQDGSDWVFNLINENTQGQIVLFEDRPMSVDLEYLRLPAPAADDATDDSPFDPTELPHSVLADIELDAVPPMQFITREFILGEEDYGSWRFRLNPVNGGMSIYDLSGHIKGLTIEGQPGRGAELIWLQSATGSTSYLSGILRAGDLGKVLTSWGQERIITSETAEISVDAQWHGAPDQFLLPNMTGLVSLDIQRGRFIRGASAGENPLLKLIGLLNFDTLARRLRLDFSDLKTEGMGYEAIEGTLQFNEGLVTITSPLQVESPSANLQFVGDINIRDQDVQAQLVATLPVAGNLTVAAALAGGVPMAVGVYVAGKLFKSQVDRVSSIRYRIRGDWNDPEVKLEKIFENKTGR